MEGISALRSTGLQETGDVVWLVLRLIVQIAQDEQGMWSLTVRVTQACDSEYITSLVPLGQPYVSDKKPENTCRGTS